MFSRNTRERVLQLKDIDSTMNAITRSVGYQADYTAWGVQVCRAVSSPRVKLLYDIYHMQVMEGDVIRTFARPIP
jgi:hydroxypyruvate isomerase